MEACWWLTFKEVKSLQLYGDTDTDTDRSYARRLSLPCGFGASCLYRVVFPADIEPSVSDEPLGTLWLDEYHLRLEVNIRFQIYKNDTWKFSKYYFVFCSRQAVCNFCELSLWICRFLWTWWIWKFVNFRFQYANSKRITDIYDL